MRRFACLEAAQQFLLRKLGCQEVKSASPTREARLSYDGQVLRQGCLRIVTAQPELCAPVSRIRRQA